MLMDWATLNSEYGDNDYVELERVGSVGLHDWRIIMAHHHGVFWTFALG
jgi:hypothetical protein